MELSIKFRLRSGQTTGNKPRQLQIRLTVDGVTPSDYASGVTVRPERWHQSDQMVMGRDKVTAEINERLAEIELQHREILRELKRRFQRGEGPRPTAELVRAEFITPGSTQPRLMVFYNEYLLHTESLVGLEEKGDKTIERMYKTRDHLTGYIGGGGGPLLPDVTITFAKRFHAWLLKDPTTKKVRMNATSAARYVSDLRRCLDFAIESGYLQYNPVDKYKPKQTDRKEVYFLEMPHIIQLMQLYYEDSQLATTLWWARLMCFTGLDYKDAVIYARDRHRYERPVTQTGLSMNALSGPSATALLAGAPAASITIGRKIVIRRSKPPRNECEIPVLPQVDILFEQYPNGPHDPCLTDINDWLRIIEGALAFPRRFSSKICRKTAGFLFLMLGYRIEAVSKMLGHSDIRTTQDHYVKVTSSFMDEEMRRIGQPVLGSGKQ